jgi:asparagine synthase (glutamine-hydrolysing)
VILEVKHVCGIVGGNVKAWNYVKAIESIKHRGPDSQEIRSEDDFTFGFVRLAIIDLDPRSNQPMYSSDNQYIIVFNGEIYNYKVVKEVLQSKGFRFRTESDTEVALVAYIHWGADFLQHIEGMFAIAIYDRVKKEILVCRDQVGIKPLYYFYDGSRFAFCSELKGLEALCHDVKFEYDFTAIYDYLTYLYIPQPKTKYRNVFTLLPAHYLIFQLNTQQIMIHQYWKLEPKLNFQGTAEQAALIARNLIQKAVDMQMVADVPVGFFLSGGIDSACVVASAAKIKNNLVTFSIGFEDDEHNETEYAKIVATKFKTKHFESIFAFSAINDLMRNMKTWYDEPFADTSAFPSYFVSKLAREHVTVVLTGDGGDEIFGGYGWYLNFLKLLRRKLFTSKWLEKLFLKLRKKCDPAGKFHLIFHYLQILFSNEFAIYTKQLGGLTKIEKEKYAKMLGIPKDYDDYWVFRKYWRPDLPKFTRLQFLDFHSYLPFDILTKVDRVSMAVALECRVPLLSLELIEFFFSLPENIRLPNSQLKGLVKESFKTIIPEIILTKKKQGFSIPKTYFQTNAMKRHEYLLTELFPEIINAATPPKG